jgi:toxin ParE1/3/4
VAQINIVWSPSSVKNLEDIADYISINSPLYAPVFVQKIVSSVERLKDYPLSGRIVPEFQNNDIREIIFHNYRVVYRLNKELIEIVTVVHGAKLLD